MNDTLKTIYDRRAVRKYKHLPVMEELIDILLSAGRMAPSAMNKQPWKFYVLHTKDKIKTFSHEIMKAAAKQIKHTSPGDIFRNLSAFHLSDIVDFFLGDNDPIFHSAPVVIFITSPKDDEWAALDIGMCAQNIMLAAKSMGMDSCPIGLAKFAMEAGIYPELHIPSSEMVHLAIALGYGNEQPEVHKRIQDNVVYLDERSSRH